jgi:hypothetical protein
MRLPMLLDKKINDFSFKNTTFNSDESKLGTGRMALSSYLEDCASYTLEVSFFKHTAADEGGGPADSPYTIDKYLVLGEMIAATFSNYFLIE